MMNQEMITIILDQVRTNPQPVEFYVAGYGPRAGQIVSSIGDRATGRQMDRESLQTVADVGELARMFDSNVPSGDIAREIIYRCETRPYLGYRGGDPR